MLSNILSKETCASCRFCCSFRRCSLWETPLFPSDTCERLKSAFPDSNFVRDNKDNVSYERMNLSGNYKTADPEEEVPCYFLNTNTGCLLSDQDKPFDCKIWPLRIMKKDDTLVIALTPTCPAINQQPVCTIQSLVLNKLGRVIFQYADTHPYIIKEYQKGFPVLMEKSQITAANNINQKGE